MPEPPFVGRDDEFRLLKDAFARRRARTACAARIDHGPGRHRQEPAGVGAREVHRRHRRERLLAPWPLAVVRRGHHLLGARRDGPPTRRAGESRTTRRRPASASPAPSPSTSPEPTTSALGRAGAADAARPRAAAAGRPRRAVRRLAHLLRADRRARARRSSCSRTSSGPTAACSTSSTTSSSGPRACPSCRHARPPGALRPAAGLGRGHAALHVAGPRAAARTTRCASCWRASCRACRTVPSRAILSRADGIPLYAVETVRSARSPTGGWSASTTRYRPVGDLRHAGHPGDAPLADRVAPGRARARRPRAPPGRVGARPGLHARRPRGRQRRCMPSELEPRCAAWSGASCWTSKPIRARRSAASTASSSRSSARSPTARSPVATGGHATLPPRATSSRSATRSWPACWPATTSPRSRRRHPGEEADAVAAQARLALRGAADRAAALGAHDQAIAFAQQALKVTTDPREQAELLLQSARSSDLAGHYEQSEALARAGPRTVSGERRWCRRGSSERPARADPHRRRTCRRSRPGARGRTRVAARRRR